MTHLQNIPHILEHGITHKDSLNANPAYVNIGDGSLISTRSERKIEVDNGKSSNTKSMRIKLGDYIPFYFGRRMPMLYVIQNGFNGVTKQLPENIVYCVCTLQKIIDKRYRYYFTDGHAIDSLSSCYDSSMVAQIDTLVDFEAAKAWDWKIARDLKRKKEAEFLVKEDVSTECIVGFICYNEKAKNQLLGMQVEERKIKIDTNYYF